MNLIHREAKERHFNGNLHFYQSKYKKQHRITKHERRMSYQALQVCHLENQLGTRNTVKIKPHCPFITYILSLVAYDFL